MRSEVDVLIEGFECDLWANSKWLTYLQDHSLGDPDLGIFAHMLSAQKVWLRRCQGESLAQLPQVDPTEAEMIALYEGWIAVLKENPDGAEIDYRRTTGEQFRQSLFHIARHVLDHGTYHRGELRGLCRTRDAWDFPETGFIARVIERGG